MGLPPGICGYIGARVVMDIFATNVRVQTEVDVVHAVIRRSLGSMKKCRIKVCALSYVLPISYLIFFLCSKKPLKMK